MRRSFVVVSLFAAVATLTTALPVHSYQEVAISNAGSITGKVVFQGSVPRRKIIPTKDRAICGGIRNEPQIVVGPDYGVRDAVVYLKQVKKGKAWEKPVKPPELNNLKCVFAPHVLALPVKSYVEIVNSDPVLHNTHGYLGRRTVFNVAMPSQDIRIKKQLRRPGLVRVECDAHGWMRAWIYVADNPYYAISTPDGMFTITDVPPGNYTLVAWQAYTGAVEIPVTVKAEEAVRLTVALKK
ncbi:hypothetical protein NKDENANG_01750 [Candidatus Entotheonellaceae bacterium PAL068K]